MGRISVSAAKAKGRALQKYVAEQIASILNVSHGYGDSDIIKPRMMGQAGVDVIIPDEYKKQFPFSIECKSGESWSIRSAIKQAKRNRKSETQWMLFLKSKSMKSPIVVLDAEVFFMFWKMFQDSIKSKEN